MTLDTVSGAETLSVEERLDMLGAQIAFLVEEARREREQRERWSELSHDLAPLARQAMDSAARELGAVDVTLEDVLHLGRTLLAALPALDAAIRQVESLGELGRDVAPLSTLAMGAVTERLQVMEEKGYFDFARSGLGIVDRIVTGYTEEDVEALGDNIVLILDTVKQMTQPEVMGMLRRTVVTVREAEEPAEPPSLFAILKEMRDPTTRRGLARVLTMLRSVGEGSPAGPEH
jgi:uncharacterized protein YjgD (DUF1641 family)